MSLGSIEVGTNGDAGLRLSEIVAAGFVELSHPALHYFIGNIKLVNNRYCQLAYHYRDLENFID